MENKDFDLGPITQGMRESPFYRKGMSTEEWFEENEHLSRNFVSYLEGTYLPLWKQKLKNND